MGKTTFWCKIKKFGSKITLLVIVLSFVLLQSVFFNSFATKSELVEAQKQATLLANLTLNRDSSNRYLINNSSDLDALRTFLSNGGETTGLTFLQTQNITLSGDFTPLGNSTEFKGTYDGDGFAIINLTINSGFSYIGFFSKTKGALLKNIVIASGSVTNSGTFSCMGALVGYATNNTRIDSCFNLGCSVIANTTKPGSTTKQVGGLVGSMSSTNTTSMTDSHRNNNSYIIDSYNSAEVKCEVQSHVGGLVGLAQRILFSGCMNNGKVKAKDPDSISGYTDSYYTCAGGIAGMSSDCRFVFNVNGASGEVTAEGQRNTTYTLGSSTAYETQKDVELPIGFLKYSYKAKSYCTNYLSYAGGICGLIEDDANYPNTTPSFSKCVNSGKIEAPYYVNKGESIVLSYFIDGQHDVIDRVDTNNDYVRLDNAFQMGYNKANVSLNTCYYLEKTGQIQQSSATFSGSGTNDLSEYKCMSRWTEGNKLYGIDTALDVSDFSKYLTTSGRNVPFNGESIGKATFLNNRQNNSCGSLDIFTLSTNAWENYIGDSTYTYLTHGKLGWDNRLSIEAVGPGIEASEDPEYKYNLCIKYAGAYHQESGALWWYEEWAEPFTVNIPIFTAICKDSREPLISNGCTGKEVAQKTQSFVSSTLGDPWVVDSTYNNGYPFLKRFLWTSNSVMPGS